MESGPFEMGGRMVANSLIRSRVGNTHHLCQAECSRSVGMLSSVWKRSPLLISSPRLDSRRSLSQPLIPLLTTRSSPRHPLLFSFPISSPQNIRSSPRHSLLSTTRSTPHNTLSSPQPLAHLPTTQTSSVRPHLSTLTLSPTTHPATPLIASPPDCDNKTTPEDGNGSSPSALLLSRSQVLRRRREVIHAAT